MYNGVYDIQQFAYIQDTLVKWLKKKITGGNLGDTLVSKGICELSLYGIHSLGKLAYQDIKNEKIRLTCFIDQKAEQYQEGFDGIPVFRPEDLTEEIKGGFILVTPEFYFYEILENLLKSGVAPEHIISLSMLV